MSKHPADSSIIKEFSSGKTVEAILGYFRRAGTPTTAEHIERVWRSAQDRGDLIPCARPAEGFTQHQSTLIQSFSGRP